MTLARIQRMFPELEAQPIAIVSTVLSYIVRETFQLFMMLSLVCSPQKLTHFCGKDDDLELIFNEWEEQTMTGA